MRFLITGASGQLGSYLLRQLTDVPQVTAWSGRRGGLCGGRQLVPVDLTDNDKVAAAFLAAQPDIVIHTAAVSVVAECHRQPDLANAVNVRATTQLAELADQSGARLVFTSTDLVFDGTQPPYSESDPPTPLSVYGRTKQAAEQAVLAGVRHAVVRLALLYGPNRNGTSGFFDQQLQALREGRPLRLFQDEWRTPLGLQNAADELIRLARSEANGITHLGGPERLSRLEMGERMARFLQLDQHGIDPIHQADIAFAEPRPVDVSLDCNRWRSLFPDARLLSWEESLRQMDVRL